MNKSSIPRPGSLVLGVDDRDVNIQILKSIVEFVGYAFVGVNSGKECLAILRNCAPRIILMDVTMPGIDGFETCRRIRRDYPDLDCKIIFQTALGAHEDIMKGIKADGNDYLVKPINSSVLNKRLIHWMGV